MIENYVAVNSDKGWIINKVSQGYVSKYKDGKDGWVGDKESYVLAINGASYQNFGNDGLGLSLFNKAHPGARNLENERLGYEALITLGNAFNNVGMTIEYGSLALSGPTEGASLIGVPIGQATQWSGVGMSSYGNAKLGNYGQMWLDILSQWATSAQFKK